MFVNNVRELVGEEEELVEGVGGARSDSVGGQADEDDYGGEDEGMLDHDLARAGEEARAATARGALLGGIGGDSGVRGASGRLGSILLGIRGSTICSDRIGSGTGRKCKRGIRYYARAHGEERGEE